MPGQMEAEREEGGGRWTSFTHNEHDLRTQKNARDYESYSDSRPTKPPRPPGQAADGSQPRGPNVKTLIANQQAAGRRKGKSTAVAHHVIRKEGPNWVLLAGGAIVTAIGVMIVRKRRPPSCEEKIIEKAVPTPGKDHVQQSGLSFATTRRESTGSRTSEPSTDSPFSGDAYMITHNVARSQSDGSRVGSEWGDDDCIPPSPDCNPPSPPGQYEYNYQHTQFSKGSNHSGRTVITPTSPPGSYRETSATEGNDLPLSPVSRSGYSSRRDMVHRLRQQLKSRDETIHDMVAQIQDQDRTISLHQAHCRELEGRLDIATRTLFDSEREIQRLRKAVADYLRGHDPGSGDWDLPPMPDVGSHEDDSDYPETTIDVFLSDHHESEQDVQALILEVKRLTEELKSEQNQKRELERIANEKLMEHEILKERLEQLEEELEEANRKVFEKDLLLEAFETHQDYQADAVDVMKRKVEGNQTPSLIGRQSLSGGHGSIYCKQTSKGKREETVTSKADTAKFPAGTVVRSNSVLFERNSVQSPSKGSSGKGWFKTDESSSPGDASEDSDVEIANPAVGQKLLMKLQEEVESLSVALAEHSQMIAEKRMETSRLVDELQKHNAVIHDLQMKMEENEEEKSEVDEQDWEKLSGLLSFSNGGTSAAQVQELSHKLEQIATQQRVEEEMGELAKHQVKIRELKDRVEKLLTKFKNMQDESAKGDAATHDQASHMIAMGLELSKTLCLQEEQAKKTSKEVARLSANFKLSSPYVPRSEKEALRKKLQGSSSESLSPGMETGSLLPINLSSMLSDVKARFSTGSEEKPKESGDTLFDRTISVSSAELTRPQSEGGLPSQMQEQYVYRPGVSGPSNRKSRRGFPIGSGSGKEPVVGGKRRASRSNKKGSSSEEKDVVISDSNRWTNKPRFQLASADANRLLFHSYTESNIRQKLFDGDQDVSSPDFRRSDFRDWLKEQRAEPSAPEAENMQVDDFQLGKRDSPKSRRQSTCSFYSVEDSSMMWMGNSKIAEGHHSSPETSVESSKGSFGRFIFDMEKGNEVYVINPDEGVQDGFQEKEGSPLAPVTELMANLELKPASSETSAQEECSFGSSISGLSTEILKALRESPKGGRD
ncbi:hypothetical protein Mapa_002869 [Marchantia paleacea]|nr:hypothetical protein Mapa_002869 [Marchantia paleacea]